MRIHPSTRPSIYRRHGSIHPSPHSTRPLCVSKLSLPPGGSLQSNSAHACGRPHASMSYWHTADRHAPRKLVPPREKRSSWARSCWASGSGSPKSRAADAACRRPDHDLVAHASRSQGQELNGVKKETETKSKARDDVRGHRREA